MSLEDLRKMGLLRDERQWDGLHRPSGVRVPALLTAGAIGAAGCVAMFVGDGGPLTWLGIGVFMVGLFAFIAVNLGGVGRTPRPKRVEPDAGAAAAERDDT